MAARRPPLTITRSDLDAQQQPLRVKVDDSALDDKTKKRANLILGMLGGVSFKDAAEAAELKPTTGRRWVNEFNERGWEALVSIGVSRGGDFLSRYHQGYWAEQVARSCLERAAATQPVPYGTSHSEPFTDAASFRAYRLADIRLQGWSEEWGRWKRPDLLMIPRAFLDRLGGGGDIVPDLQRMGNRECDEYVSKAKAAIEVETSLWHVGRALSAKVGLSFPVKEEDLAALQAWVSGNHVPLFIVQVFWDCVYALPFQKLEDLIALPTSDARRITPSKDRKTKKSTYKVPLAEGARLCDLTPPTVSGGLFEVTNGGLSVYGQLQGSEISDPQDPTIKRLGAGKLTG